MKTFFGENEPGEPISKESAKAWNDECGKMMSYFNGICERCGKQRRNCSAECLVAELQAENNGN